MSIQHISSNQGLEIPSDFVVKYVEEAYIHCVRPDGLAVFLDRGTDEVSLKLNYVRVHANKEQTIKTVGLVRGMQVALNFAKKYCSELVPQLTEDIQSALAHIKLIG